MADAVSAVRVVITGGAGFLGSLLARRLLTCPLTLRGGQPAQVGELLLVDLVAPPADLAADGRVRPVVGEAGAVLEELGEVDAVFHLAGVVSGAAEADFDLGLHTNLDGTRSLLEYARQHRVPPVFVFTSSLAVFGSDPAIGPISVVDDDTLPRPQSSYGIQKFIGEQLVADYTRKGFVTGRSVRLMSVSVRPGKPNAAASSFLSGIIREPLAGERSVCPVPPATRVALSSPRRTLQGIVLAAEASDASWGSLTAMNLPALTTTPREMAASLDRVAGAGTSDRIDWSEDPATGAIVRSWPAEFRTPRAEALGLRAEDSFDEIVRAYLVDNLGLTSSHRGRRHALRDSLPTAAEVLSGLPEPRPDDDSLRASIRAMRAADGVLLGVLDDDPTGSQAVHGVQVVTVLEEEAYEAALAGPAATCFVLTNTRSLEEPAATEINVLAARGLGSVAGRRGARLQLVSRSDSTLRGHVMAEVSALDSVRRETAGRGYDGVLLVPAFLEAGRLTAGDIHWARVGSRLVPVGETEFAQDATFGYTASDLRDFVAEKSGGTIRRDDVGSIGLADIRLGGPQRVRELLAGVRDGGWAVVNATEYSDLEAVAAGVLMAERAGASFLFRTGPSFVRALAGMGPRAPLRGADIWPTGRPPRGGHGLVVVGSHVGQTSRQLAALRARGGITAVELDVPAIVGGGEVAAGTARQVAAALRDTDVLLYTSRAAATGQDGAGSLAIARAVSAAVSRTVREALAARPAWVIAKGGITSHDVAWHGLGIRRAEVAGQLFPGIISLLRPLDSAPEAIGVPYVVFAGNVGDDGTLADVVAILNGEGEER